MDATSFMGQGLSIHSQRNGLIEYYPLKIELEMPHTNFQETPRSI